MGLFDNFSNVLDLVLQDQDTSGSQALAKRADVSVADFSKVAAIGVPTILQAIQRNTEDDSGLDSLNQALNKHQDVEHYQSINFPKILIPKMVTRYWDMCSMTSNLLLTVSQMRWA